MRRGLAPVADTGTKEEKEAPAALRTEFDFDLPRKNRELSRRCCFLQVDTVVDCDARLQVRDFHKCIA